MLVPGIASSRPACTSRNAACIATAFSGMAALCTPRDKSLRKITKTYVRSSNARYSATCSLALGPVPGEARSRRPVRRSHFGCPRWSCGSHLACADRAPRERGEAQEGFVQLEVALPSWLVMTARSSRRNWDEPGGHRHGPAQALGHDRGDGRRRDRGGRRPVRHRCGRLPGDAGVR